MAWRACSPARSPITVRTPPRYDDWWRREGDHDLGDDSRQRWEAEISNLTAALVAFGPLGDVLEFAGGTGN
jgi:hypothetical protein